MREITLKHGNRTKILFSIRQEILFLLLVPGCRRAREHVRCGLLVVLIRLRLRLQLLRYFVFTDYSYSSLNSCVYMQTNRRRWTIEIKINCFCFFN